MNYIWEIAVALYKKGIGRGTVFYKQAEEYSPYYEQAFPCLNEESLTEPVIEVNGLYRFEALFGGLLSPQNEGNEPFKAYLFDIIMHYVTEIDLMKGLTKENLYIRKIRQDILRDHYGGLIRSCFGRLEEGLQYTICRHLLAQFQTGSSVLMFSRTVRALFADAIVYKNNLNQKQILVYVGRKKEEEVDARMELAVSLFLPTGYFIRMFYEHHFGILDVDETLLLDQIEIF